MVDIITKIVSYLTSDFDVETTEIDGSYEINAFTKVESEIGYNSDIMKNIINCLSKCQSYLNTSYNNGRLIGIYIHITEND